MKKRGHWCWCCQRTLPDERFSGRGHAGHLCKDCARLPPEERAYRQSMGDIERILVQGGKFRKKRARLARFLADPDPRVRQLVCKLLGPEAIGPQPDLDDEGTFDEAPLSDDVCEPLYGNCWTGDEEIPF